jgi:putative ATP-dependent endonuclease of OLD family
VFVTFDLDSKGIVEKSLTSLGLQDRVDYLAIGIDEAGKRSIEGLLPEALRTKVRATNPELADALSGTTDERNKAAYQLKKPYLEEFKREAKPGDEYFKRFYEVVRMINRAFRAQASTATSNQGMQATAYSRA